MTTTRINIFRAKNDMVNNLREFLVAIIPRIEQSPGCRSCQLLQRQDDIREFVVIEVWDSVAAHEAAVKTIPPDSIRVVMLMLETPPNGSYYSDQGKCPWL